MRMFVYQTIKRFLQLDPVLVDEVAVVFSMPEASVPLQLTDTGLKASDRTAPCAHMKDINVPDLYHKNT